MVHGTTGEASTLSNAEHHRVIEVCIEQAAGRVPVIAGCGSNDTKNALLHMNFSKKSGATAALVVAPYYNRPSQAGLIAHFSHLAENNDLPIVLYNVPGRTVTDLKPETVCELANRFPGRIIGIKDASGDLSRMPIHMADIGTDAYEQEFTLSLVANEEGTLELVELALERIKLRKFGLCEECGGVIAKKRLEAIPFAPMCIRCAEKMENARPRQPR